MNSAKQIVFILIGVAMIAYSVVLIFMKQSSDTAKGRTGEKTSGSYVFSEPVKSLVFEAGACKIEILEGEGTGYQIDFDDLKYGTLTHKLEGEILTISYEQNDDWVLKMFSLDDIDDQKITLTIPKDAELDSASFEFGAADVTIETLVVNELNLMVGAGSLRADRISATNATADCGVGAMELRVSGKQEDYRGELNCGLGEIDFGDISIEGSGKKSYGTSSAERRMDIKCGLGEVDVRFYN